MAVMITAIIGTPMSNANGTRRYWVAQFHVMLEGCVNVKAVLVSVPDWGTLPVPVHPEQVDWVAMEDATGEVTDASTDAPPLNHPVVGVGEP